MQAIAGGNRFLNTIIDIGDVNLSDETIEHFNAQIIPCVGTRGTVYLHTGNVWHRSYLKKGSPRKIIGFDFSPGFNILLDSKAIAKSLRNNYDLDSMTPRQRKILSGLFPQTPFKGFRLTNNEFKQIICYLQFGGLPVYRAEMFGQILLPPSALFLLEQWGW